MNLPFFIAKRITFSSNRTFSKLIVRIAILGIMLGLAVMILSVAIVKGFKSEIREKVRGFAGDIQIVKYDLNTSFENSPFDINPVTLKTIKKYPEIEYAQPFATKPGIINTNEEVEGVVLKGVDKNYNWDYFKNILVSGRTINFKDSVQSQKEILISQYTAGRLNVKVGDDFLMYFVQQPLRKRKFVIAGIYNLGVEDVDVIALCIAHHRALRQQRRGGRRLLDHAVLLRADLGPAGVQDRRQVQILGRPRGGNVGRRTRPGRTQRSPLQRWSRWFPSCGVLPPTGPDG